MKSSFVSALITTAVVGLLSACATTEQQIVEPIASVIDADIAAQLDSVQAPTDKALICVYRPNRFVGSANIYRIVLNGTPVADLKVGTRLVSTVVPGPTTLAGTMGPNIVFETEAGKVYFIDVKTAFDGGPEFEFVDATAALEAVKNLSATEPICTTAKDVERINRGAIKRVAHIKGDNAIIFIALDPIWSEPEFQYEGHHDENFVALVKQGREELQNAGIDEVVVWKLPRIEMGAAVPFKNGCVVSGYGEPDYLEKLMLMHKAFLLISEHGLDDPRVRSSITNLLMASRYSGHYDDEMVDIMIDRLRFVMKKTNSSN